MGAINFSTSSATSSENFEFNIDSPMTTYTYVDPSYKYEAEPYWRITMSPISTVSYEVKELNIFSRIFMKVVLRWQVEKIYYGKA